MKYVFWTIGIVLVLLIAFDIRLKTVFYRIDSDKVKGNIRIGLVTDLHSYKYGKDQKKLIEAIDKQKPDIIAMSGDIFDESMPIDNAKVFMDTISKKYPCYYVTGNHESRSKKHDEIMKAIYDSGITVLSGSCDTIQVGADSINICGVDDPRLAKRNESVVSFDKELESLKNAPDNGFFTVLLSHRPELVNFYENYNFDLILSGHAHGGQWRIPGILNGLFAPNQGLFPKYAGGEYTLKNNSTLIISRGLAKAKVIIPRIFNRPEFVVIDISNSNK